MNSISPSTPPHPRGGAPERSPLPKRRRAPPRSPRPCVRAGARAQEHLRRNRGVETRAKRRRARRRARRR
eukprot:1652752-Prymnesium_polylepis.1